jgi:hypothetical protein
MKQRLLCVAAAAGALTLSGWTTSIRAQALSGDPNQTHKAGTPAGGEVNGEAGVRTGNAAAGETNTTDGNQDIVQQQNPMPKTNLAAADADGIRRTISELTEAALQPNTLSQVSQYVTTEDANRLRDIGRDNSVLDQQLQTFQRNWKQKYNQDFAIRGQQLVLGDRNVQIVSGVVAAGNANNNSNNTGTANNNNNTNDNQAITASASTPGANSVNGNRNVNATAAGNTSANPTAGNADITAQANNPNATAAGTASPNATAGNQSPAIATGNLGANAGANTGAAATGNTGTPGAMNRVATVIIPASQNLPEATVIMARQSSNANANANIGANAPTNENANAAGAGANANAMAETWKIDLPDSVDTRQIQQNLTHELRNLNEKQASWPANANEGYSMVAHAVLLALSQPGEYPRQNNNLNNGVRSQQRSTRGGVGQTGATGSTNTGATGSTNTGAATGAGSTGAGANNANTGNRPTGAGSTGANP